MKTTKKERQGWPYVSHELYIGLANSCLCLVSTKSSHFIPCYHPVTCLVSLFSLKWNSKHSRWVNIKKRSVDGCSLKVLAASPFINCHSDAHFAPNMNLSGIFLWESPLGRLCSLSLRRGQRWGERMRWNRWDEERYCTVWTAGGSEALWRAAVLTRGEPLTVLPSKVRQDRRHPLLKLCS